MKILAVDTAGEGLSLALGEDARVLRCARSRARANDEALFPTLERLLKRQGWRLEDIEAVAASNGPGRFTAVRVGMVFAAMLGKSLAIPVVAVSRLEALAMRPGAAPGPGIRFAAALPAFKGEWYFQVFRGTPDGAVADGAPRWLEADGLDAALRGPSDEARPLRRADEAAPLAAADMLGLAVRRIALKTPPPFMPLYLKPANFLKTR